MGSAAEQLDYAPVWSPQPGPQTALLSLPESVNDAFYGGARGGGKGLRADEAVLTPFGWRSLESLKVGDALCAVDGTTTKVLALHERGEQPFYRCHLSDNSVIDCDADHIWYGWRVNQMRKVENERVSGQASARKYSMRQLLGFVNSERDRAAAATNRFAIPVPKPVRFNVAGQLRGPGKFQKRMIPAYTLGVLLGDGSLGSGTPSFTTIDPQIAAEVAADMEGIAEVRKRSDDGRAPSYGLINGGQLRRDLDALGIEYCLSQDKFIPRIYQLASIDERWALLQGLMDTDGWAEEDGDIYFTSVSRKLAEDVRELAWSLGGVVTWREKIPTYTHNKEKLEGRLAFTLRMKFRDNGEAFRLERKRERCAGREYQSLCRYIERIEPIAPANSICIEVEHPTSLFITRDYIVTHNSDSTLGDWLQHQGLYGQHANGIVFRRNRVQLIELEHRAVELFVPLGAKYNATEHRFTFPNGARIRFAYLERDIDAEQYQGHAYSRVYVEELTQFPDPAPIDKLKATLRSAHGVPCCFRATGNPGGAGHLWVKARYIDPHPAGYTIIRDHESGMHRVFIPAKVTDNPALTDNDPGYVNRLKATGSPALVRAWLDGDWDAVQGAFLEGVWVPEKHIVEPFTIPLSWTRWRAMDWGFARPYAIGWYAMDHDGCVYLYRELYGTTGQPNVGSREDARVVARRVVDIEEAETDRGVKFDRSPADRAIWSKIGAEHSIAENFFNEGVYFVKSDSSPGSRVNGAQEVVARLNEGSFKVFANCKHWLRTVPVIMADEKNPDDVDTEQEDHQWDATRYSLMSRRRTPKAPPKPRRKDPHARTFDDVTGKARWGNDPVHDRFKRILDEGRE